MRRSCKFEFFLLIFENLQGITAASSTGDAASDVDYIVTSLPRTQDVEKVLHMDGGIFASAAPKTMIVDSSTISPIAAKEFYESAKEKDMTFLDTPMSGGIMGAANGSLTFMVGSKENDEY